RQDEPPTPRFGVGGFSLPRSVAGRFLEVRGRNGRQSHAFGDAGARSVFAAPRDRPLDRSRVHHGTDTLAASTRHLHVPTLREPQVERLDLRIARAPNVFDLAAETAVATWQGLSHGDFVGSGRAVRMLRSNDGQV